LTQSAVTQQIKALESEMDVPLFDRAAGCVKKSRAAGVQHLFQIHTKAESNY
jgi:Bacterial regulatory helix-turn-helix protein, lysR family